MANVKKNQKQLSAELDKAKRKIKIARYYAHFKHPGEKRYQILDIGIFEKTGEICVIYKSLDTGMSWIRTIDNFLEKVEVGGKKVKRFELWKRSNLF